MGAAAAEMPGDLHFNVIICFTSFHNNLALCIIQIYNKFVNVMSVSVIISFLFIKEMLRNVVHKLGRMLVGDL